MRIFVGVFLLWFGLPHIVLPNQYTVVQRPVLQYVDKKYFPFANITSLRIGRRSNYYINFNYETTVVFDNNVTISISFFEFLSNEYRPSFVEIKFEGCSKFRVFPVVQSGLGKFNIPCPHPIGTHNYQNLSIPLDIIKNFPIKKGRIVANITIPPGQTIATGHLDFQIMDYKDKKNIRY